MLISLSPQVDSETDAYEKLLGKIPVQNIWYMLLYAWELAEYKEQYSVSTETAPSLKELFARLLVQITNDVIRRGIQRSYTPIQASLAGIKGRVLFSESIKQNTFQKHRAVCSYTHYSEDNLLNQIVKATINALIAWLNHARVTEMSRLQHNLIELRKYFQNVSDIRLFSGLFQQVTIHRNNQSYKLLLRLCEMVYLSTMPSETGHKNSFLKVIEEQFRNHDLYEKFLRQFYKMHLGDYIVKSEILRWPVSPLNPYMPSMKTDISLLPIREGCRIVIDAKWYAHTLSMSRHDNRGRFISAHLYQLYAYLRTQEGDPNPKDNQAQGILLYPAVDTHLQECFSVQGHQMKIATIDLTLPWQAIEVGLLEIINRWI